MILATIKASGKKNGEFKQKVKNITLAMVICSIHIDISVEERVSEKNGRDLGLKRESNPCYLYVKGKARQGNGLFLQT